MADSSDMQNNETSNPGDIASVDEESKPRIMKRPRPGMISSSTDNSEDSEPDEKRPAFRLQPPTLIHGIAKSVPKQEDISSASAATSASKCKFLQPPKLSALSSSTTTNKATVSKEEKRGTEPEPLVSSSNPFLRMVNKNAAEASEQMEGAVDSVEQDGEVDAEKEDTKVNGNAKDETKPDSTTDVEIKDKEQKDNEAKQENLFSQAPSSTSNNAGIGGFVFGSKMEDRVVISGESKSPKEKNNGETASSGFVFGQNLSERAKVSSSTDSNPSFLPTTNEVPNSADSSSAIGETTQDASGSHSPSSSDKKQPFGLKEDAAAHFLASQSRPALPEVEVKTGEEDEKNVLQIQCKLHQFDAADQNWLERGVGSLHLNDGKYSDDNLHFQSRLVMRVHGSLRLVLNTKIWPQMTVERASNKSVRVSAQTDEGTIGVFLITGTINDAEQIFRALEYRVLNQKQLEEKRKALQKKQEKKKKDTVEPGAEAEEKDSSCHGEATAKEDKSDESLSNHKESKSSAPPDSQGETPTSEPKVQSDTGEKVDSEASAKADSSSSGAPL